MQISLGLCSNLAFRKEALLKGKIPKSAIPAEIVDKIRELQKRPFPASFMVPSWLLIWWPERPCVLSVS